MKERIRELAKQAGGHGLKMSTMGLSLLGEDAIEKFAQLIVKECCEVAHCNFHVDGLTLGSIMREHFGMEK
jgi:hypothetical protein